MEPLAILRDLQITLDNLGTVQRALAALPPDLAALDQRIRAAEKLTAEKTRQLESAKNQIQNLTRDLALAQKEEERARAAVKATSQKVHYTAAIRELDDKERMKAGIARPLQALEAQSLTLAEALVALEAERSTAQAQFDELHAIFLDEHANQVEGRKLLQARQTELEALLPASEIARFHRIAAVRQGRVVVPVENSACTGCRVKLRGPLLFSLRESKTPVSCESCQRILYLP
ncbi:MAG: hypothetical protein WCL47_01765 [Holophagaceae bacterium]